MVQWFIYDFAADRYADVPVKYVDYIDIGGVMT